MGLNSIPFPLFLYQIIINIIIMPTTRKSLKESLKRSGRRLPHGYELVARKKRTTKTAKRKTVRKKATKRRR